MKFATIVRAWIWLQYFLIDAILHESLSISTAIKAVPLAIKKSKPTGIYLVLKFLLFLITWVQFIQKFLDVCIATMAVPLTCERSNLLGTKFELIFVCLFSDLWLIIKLKLIRTLSLNHKTLFFLWVQYLERIIGDVDPYTALAYISGLVGYCLGVPFCQDKWTNTEDNWQWGSALGAVLQDQKLVY